MYVCLCVCVCVCLTVCVFVVGGEEARTAFGRQLAAVDRCVDLLTTGSPSQQVAICRLFWAATFGGYCSCWCITIYSSGA